MHEEHCSLTYRLKTLLRRFPKLYLFLIYTISPMCFGGISPQKFLKRFQKDAVLYNIGSGVHRFPGVKNVDIEEQAGIDIVADAMNMPFNDNSTDGVICEMLIEHVPQPQKVVDEILRILKPGGTAYISCPFVFPFHACPNDYYRWSSTGLRELCKEGDIETIGARAGPSSALTAQLITWFAILLSFGSNTL